MKILKDDIVCSGMGVEDADIFNKITLNMDIVSRATRSKMMASVRSKNTKPEKKVRSLLHTLGYRFRLHRKDLPGNPDIVLPKFKKVIFVNGCYWHQHPGCPKSKRSSSRRDFWDKKLDENMERDKRNVIKLSEMGWIPYIIWECQTKSDENLKRIIKQIFA